MGPMTAKKVVKAVRKRLDHRMAGRVLGSFALYHFFNVTCLPDVGTFLSS